MGGLAPLLIILVHSLLPVLCVSVVNHSPPMQQSQNPYALKLVLSSQTTIRPIIDPTLEIIDTAAVAPRPPCMSSYDIVYDK